jgi:hypothetical protein
LIRPPLLAAAFISLASAGVARAADDSVVIKGGTVTGTGTVNVAAGNTNQQANAAVIASGGVAAQAATVVQSMDDARDSGGALSATVAPGSFAGSSGWLAINGAAGSGNQQANLALIALGMTGAAMSDTALSQSRASHEPTGGPEVGATSNERSVAIGGAAFANSSGLVQVSLIGGDRNSSANIFALSGSTGANP